MLFGEATEKRERKEACWRTLREEEGVRTIQTSAAVQPVNPPFGAESSADSVSDLAPDLFRALGRSRCLCGALDDHFFAASFAPSSMTFSSLSLSLFQSLTGLSFSLYLRCWRFSGRLRCNGLGARADCRGACSLGGVEAVLC